MKAEPLLTNHIESAVTQIIETVGPELIVAAPLGLGKPNRLLNALYARVKAAPETLSMKIYTALSLRVPEPKQLLQQRFIVPFAQRHFGKDYPQLDYLKDILEQQIPANITVHEFYFSSGSQLNNNAAQRHYISRNYTHVARDLVQSGVNVMLQQVAQREQRYSLASNSDITLDLIDAMNKQQKPFFMVAVVNSAMPFLGGEADVCAERFDLILDDGQSEPLFGIPREAVGDAEHAIGLHASSLVKDGGTLQIGIGALSDALVNGLIMRHQRNPVYLQALKALHVGGELNSALVDGWGGVQPLVKGLYGATEMVMDGFMHLRRAGILSREVYEDIGLQKVIDSDLIANKFDQDTLGHLLNYQIVPKIIDAKTLAWLISFGLIDSETSLMDSILTFPDNTSCGNDLSDPDNFNLIANAINGRRLISGRYLEGAFFLGSSELYKWLQQLQGDDWDGLKMQRVSQINQFYGGQESLERVQRREARFFNTCMMHTLTGAAVSDGLEDGQVVSGVGGQYNFVAMAHALDDGRSIIMLRSTRKSSTGLHSNIVWNYAHCTIPRHLRDIVITEYGIADVRGQCDEEVIKRLLSITDAGFQIELMQSAKAAGKLDTNFEIPSAWRNNTPQKIAQSFAKLRSQGEFSNYPFGSDFDPIEQQLLVALLKLKDATRTPWGKLLSILRSLKTGNPSPESKACMQRMGLHTATGFSEKLQARLLKSFL